jgi:lipoprotein-anchoring transpeptidase ErfK/SrfK
LTPLIFDRTGAMFGLRFGVYLISILCPLAAHAAEPDSLAVISAGFTGIGQGREIVPAIVKAQVLLDRMNISSGEIDGRPSPRLDEAISAFAEIHNLPPDTGWSRAFWDELTGEAIVAPLVTYAIKATDLKGPFVQLPARMEDQIPFKSLGYANAREALAEKFHMSVELLAALNPDATFAQAGEEITVANVLTETRSPPSAARIDVDKDRQTVKVYGAKGELVALFPASVGSEDKPTPSGRLKVTAINSEPTYRYNPRYQFPEVETRKAFDLQPGPNSPLGVMWIALSKPSYGIHGTPEPSEIGRAASHGCVRLTNWDAQRLAAMVTRGVPVNFIEKPDATFVAY